MPAPKHDNWRSRVYRKIDKSTDVPREEWRELRAAVLERDNFTCIRCEKKSKNGRGLTAHHVLPRAQGGPNILSNLVTLCLACHDYVECNDLPTVADIIGSYELPLDDPHAKPPKEEILHEETFARPAWHKYVYGGCRRQ